METNKTVLSRDDFLAMNNDYEQFCKKLSKKRTTAILISVVIAILIIVIGTPLVWEIDSFTLSFWFPMILGIISFLIFVITIIVFYDRYDKQTKAYGNKLYAEYLEQKDAL